AGGAVVVALRVARLGRRLHRIRRTRERCGDALIEMAQRDGWQRIRLASRRIEIRLRIAGDAKLTLRLAVPGLQIVVRDRPVEADTESRTQPEIVGHEPQRRTQPVPRRAADL